MMEILKKKTKAVFYKDIKVGGDAPVSVQSMTNTPTSNYNKTLKQIRELEKYNCEIIRLAVKTESDVNTLKKLTAETSTPLIADIQFDYKIAIKSIKAGIAGLRLNPGNITDKWKIKEVVDAAKDLNIPIRIGVNQGSLEKSLRADVANNNISFSEALVKSAEKEINILEKENFTDIVVSLKSSNALTTIDSYKLFSTKFNYPLHLGITEAGTLMPGLIKSSLGIGHLLLEGIGDTIRISLTANPVEEVKAGYLLLKTIGLRKDYPELVSCPTCSRCEVDLISLAKKVEQYLYSIRKNITVAVMGCVVNGPGEAANADIGITAGKGVGLLFKKGEIIKKIPEKDLFNELLAEIEKI